MKTLKRVLSVVVALTMLMSMMTFTVLANNTATIDVTYYTDAAMGTVATKVAPGESVYALLTLNLPFAQFRTMNVDVTATNATLAAEANGNLWDAVLNSEMAGRLERGTLNPGQNVLGNIQITKVMDASKGWDNTAHQYADISSTTVPVVLYKLDVADGATGNVSVAVAGNLNLGYYDEEEESTFDTPFTVNANSLPIEAAAADVISYSAALKADKVDPESATLVDDVKALVEVTRTLNSVGSVYAIDAANIAVDTAAKTVTVTFPNDKTTGQATQTLSYAANLMTISYGTPVVTVASSFDYAMTEDEIADQVVVTVVKTKDGVLTELTLVEGTHYNASAAFLAAANTGFVRITFIGDYAGNTQVDKSFTRTNAPVSYKDVVATISGSPFDFGTTPDQIKSAIAVKGTKVEGVVETPDQTVPEDAYDIAVDLDAKTATVTMKDSTPVDNTALTFEISAETFTYSNYTVKYTGEDEYVYTTNVDIAALVKVEATKTSNENPSNTETVDLTNEVIVTVDKENDKITIVWEDESAHKGAYTFSDITVTFNDVITYQNGSAIMNKTSFVEGTEADDIIAEVVVTLEKLVNGVKDDTFVPADPADYTVSYADNKVTVDFTADGIADVEIPVTFYPATAVTAKVVLDTTTVVDNKVTKDEDFIAYIELVGLTSAWGGEFTLSVNKGTIKAVEAATGYTINNVPALNAASTTVEYTKAIVAGDGEEEDTTATAGARVLKVTVSTVGALKDEVVTLSVDSMKVSQVEDFVIDELPTQTSEAKASVTIDEFVRAAGVALPKVEIGITTLGTLADDKYVDGVSIDGIDLTDKVSVDAAGRKLVIEDVVLDGSATDDEVTYTLEVVVPGYTTIEADIVIEYVSDEAAADYNTWKIKSNEITADSKIYAGDVTGGDNTITAADYSDIVAVYGNAIADKYDLYEGGATVDQKDIITMVWAFEQYGMTQVSTAGIIE
ncbi:MAG: hypothetical protein E7404_01965 [Ruminococcaceae bacterium]|nr:hypothetical protein [Oscillospiraceae bacterium]